MAKISARVLSKINRNKVYRLIYDKKDLSKKDIITSLDISSPTASKYLDDLYEKELVFSEGFYKSTGGRKPRKIMCNYNAFFAIGISVTMNTLQINLINLLGESKEVRTFSVQFISDPSYYLKIKNELKDILAQNDISNEKILGVGISIPAIVSKDGMQIYRAPLFEARVSAPEIEKIINFPVRLFNDANASGFAELWCKPGTENMVYLSLNDTVGSAVILNRNIYYGVGCVAGEIGHMTLHPKGKRCYCGKLGCVDSYCSTNVITANDGRTSEFFTRLEANSKKDLAIWNEYLDNLALTIDNIHKFIDCEIVIGGYVGRYMPKYIDELKRKASELDTFNSDLDYIKPCIIESDASSMGAGLYFINSFIKKI